MTAKKKQVKDDTLDLTVQGLPADLKQLANLVKDHEAKSLLLTEEQRMQLLVLAANRPYADQPDYNDPKTYKDLVFAGAAVKVKS